MTRAFAEKYPCPVPPPGPWDTEPDHVDFEHAGLPCIIHRQHMGAWCGYAAVPPGHPAHGKSYADIDGEINVHGGLTYADKCQGEICHVPKPGEPDDVWWFGFDCLHCCDLAPSSRYPTDDEIYRDQAYVTAETKRLAEQLAAMQGAAT